MLQVHSVSLIFVLVDGFFADEEKMKQKLKEAAQMKKDLGLEMPNSEAASGALSTAGVSSIATSALDEGG